MRLAVPALGAATIAVLTAAPAAGAQSTIAELRAPAKVTAYGSVIAWSEYEPASREFHLMVREGGEQPRRVAVGPRRVPFDVDAGRREGGGTVLAYSRCRREPAYRFGAAEAMLPNWSTGRGCDLYLYDLESGRERRIRSVSARDASEFMPSVDGDRIAFARVFERRRGTAAHVPGLFLAFLERGGSRRMHSGPRGVYERDRRGRIESGSAGAGPSALDLRGRRAAVLWEWRDENRGSPCQRSAVLVELLRGLRPVRQSRFDRAAECGETGEGQTLVSATIDRGDVVYGRRRSIFDVPPAETVHLLQANYHPRARARSSASPGDIVSVTRSRRTGFAVTTPASAGGRFGDDPVPTCSGASTREETHPPDCRLTELPNLLPR
ncbi:MAG: hypothetical protein WD844_05210 [Thermoleophilaceae bacterium]